MSTVAVVGILGWAATAHATTIDACSITPFQGCTYLQLDAAASAQGALGNVSNENDTPQGTETSLDSQSSSGGASASNVWTFDLPDCCGGSLPLMTTTNAAAHVDFGSVGVSASSTSNNFNGYAIINPLPNQPSFIPNPNDTGGFASAVVFFEDAITPASDGVETFSFDLQNATAYDSVTAFECQSSSEINESLFVDGTISSIHMAPCTSTALKLDVPVQVYADQPAYFELELEAATASSAGPNAPGSTDFETAFADAFDTGYLAISGVNYTSASRTIYPTSLPVDNIPEPSSLAILTVSLIGLACLVWLRSAGGFVGLG